MMPFDIPIVEIFLGMLGFCLAITFCTTFCKACSHLREEQIEREVWRHSEQAGRSIYFIPFPRSMSQQDSEDHLRVPRHSQDLQTPPQYNTDVCCGPPPSYNELGFKPDDLPPAYAEYYTPVRPITPPPHLEMVQSQT